MECVEQRALVGEENFIINLEGINVAGINKVFDTLSSSYVLDIDISSADGVCYQN